VFVAVISDEEVRRVAGVVRDLGLPVKIVPDAEAAVEQERNDREDCRLALWRWFCPPCAASRPGFSCSGCARRLPGAPAFSRWITEPVTEELLLNLPTRCAPHLHHFCAEDAPLPLPPPLACGHISAEQHTPTCEACGRTTCGSKLCISRRRVCLTPDQARWICASCASTLDRACGHCSRRSCRMCRTLLTYNAATCIGAGSCCHCADQGRDRPARMLDQTSASKDEWLLQTYCRRCDRLPEPFCVDPVRVHGMGWSAPPDTRFTRIGPCLLYGFYHGWSAQSRQPRPMPYRVEITNRVHRLAAEQFPAPVVHLLLQLLGPVVSTGACAFCSAMVHVHDRCWCGMRLRHHACCECREMPAAMCESCRAVSSAHTSLAPLSIGRVVSHATHETQYNW
jgi:hypothetical protein